MLESGDVMKKERLIVSTKLPKGEDGYKTFSIRIKDSTVQGLDTVVEQSGRSRNEIIGIFLEYALENYIVK